MAKADLPKAESLYAVAVGACIDRAAKWLGWSLKELASAVGRNERQVARWIAGVEHPQLDVLFAVAALRAPLVIQLAALADCDVTTTISIRRTA